MKQAAGCYAARWVPLLCGLALTGCHKQVPPLASHIHYEVGSSYMVDGRWLYPRQEFAYRESGLAVMDTNTSVRLTADGEVYDPQAMAGAHPTLQLPIQVTVRNLDNGRQITVRLNDRGPAQRGRLLSLTPSAAQLLGMGQGAARVEVVEDELPSRVFAETLPGGPLLAMNAAPVETVREEALDAPGRPTGAARTSVQNASITPPVALPVLPATYVQNIPTSGSLWVETGRFTQRSYAAMEAAKAGGTVRYASESRGPAWSVRVGPFQTVNEADTALDQALGLGLTGAHIVVE